MVKDKASHGAAREKKSKGVTLTGPTAQENTLTLSWLIKWLGAPSQVKNDAFLPRQRINLCERKRKIVQFELLFSPFSFFFFPFSLSTKKQWNICRTLGSAFLDHAQHQCLLHIFARENVIAIFSLLPCKFSSLCTIHIRFDSIVAAHKWKFKAAQKVLFVCCGC
ncbi:hypothetical protein RJT34_08065 [Clitoria ternatea]|uniref:Uncharacterized protein n=1 Tax=Clitoria ternatea TaxID=43366 RepID=A0AAN9K5V4_CLITE